MQTDRPYTSKSYDAIVIGGGFFGAIIASHLRERGLPDVVILEKGPELLQRASYNNQARIHNGYHYPRNMVTALRSRINFPRFVSDFRDCVDDSFQKIYAVARIQSKVTGNQFQLFAERIGAPMERAAPSIRDLFNPDLVEEVFLVTEYAFDPNRLRELVQLRLRELGVETRLGTEALRVASPGHGLMLTCNGPNGEQELHAPLVLNCTYSQINRLLAESGLPLIALKHELTELAVIDVPEPLQRFGVTVMCGPFFSCMPFPALGAHTLSHVRYTPHGEWHDRTGTEYRDAHALLETTPKTTNFPRMLRDAERYLPSLAGARYRRSLWEVKTVLPMNENDDGRPILFKHDHGLPGLTCIMGGKIDNIYDALDEVDSILQRH